MSPFLCILLGIPAIGIPFALHKVYLIRQDIKAYKDDCQAIRQAIIDKGVI